MENELKNTAEAVGNYNNIPTSMTTTASVVTMVSGLTMTKTADKEVWVDGELTYTITINNQTNTTYSAPIITDILDSQLITFVDGSVTINGTNATSDEYEYESLTNKLTIKLTDINATNSTIVKFKVAKKS